ncbi:MAG: acylphosphatase [Planctomycetota bacterium]
MATTAIKRAHVYFTGNVQGVGFRFTASRFAESAGIAGRVRNIPGGGVELVAEHHQKRAIDDFIRSLTAQFDCDASVDWSEPPSHYADFDISYGFSGL